MIAALYVATGGCYYGLSEVDPWDRERDARLYAGPHPVVAHPPCERWGRYWYGGPKVRERLKLGDDGGCFAAALEAVRRWGGVLEHPADSHAWATFEIARPPRAGGWIDAGDGRGWTCCVEQGHYGHPARKLTWLYAVAAELPALRWGQSAPATPRRPIQRRLFESPRREARRIQQLGTVSRLRHSSRSYERAATPPAFRDVLIAIARNAR